MARIKTSNVIEGASPATELRSYTVRLTGSQVRSLSTTARTLIPAPGAGFGIVLDHVVAKKTGTTAFSGIAAGEDLRVRYDGATVNLASFETTGFLDQTDGPSRYSYAHTTAAVEPLEDTAVEVDNSGAITGGSAVEFTSYYRLLEV